MALALVAVAATTAAATIAARMDESRFPHEKHARVFPTCVGCHAGIVSGNEARLFPEPALCGRCHDGRNEKRVEWEGPRREPSNLRFSHVEHQREAGGEMGPDTATCQRCHTAGGAGPRMAVQEARPRECLSCHEHRATAHLASDNRCSTCHVTVVQARALPDSAVARFPYPASRERQDFLSHERPDFLTNHAPRTEADLAQCAVCHARESCARCHINAGSVRSIAALEPDARVARLVSGREAEYPVPASHRQPDFAWEHGELARKEIQSCANCHAQPSCRSCHLEGRNANEQIARLPKPQRGGAQGVILRGEARAWPGWRSSWNTPSLRLGAPEDAVPTAHRRNAPAIDSTRHGGPPPTAESIPGAAEGGYRAVAYRRTPPRDTNRVRGPRDVGVHPPGFERTHGAAAASGQLDCTGCHARKFCSDCHDGEGSRRYHPPDFVERHAANSYARETECSSCHNTEAFCRQCHTSIGLRATGRLTVAFHSAQPNWLLAHGRAARQGLQSCTSCHVQQDCMQCHSQAGWGVSPHGPGFDAERMQKKNPDMCRRCHFTNPLGGR
ncbi:MAG TPA: hypothetical protein VFS05_08650 [Gemmatimonadaceae bacterium]|nr:hypothetical protein [Gemmatimonadaceae bacterium]